mmetsp:Transcript_2805/g.7549  ORF Transcript_2805/g.7549 Transcript_2805/m.7549 type:complete len:269 (+) Transcript_2805:1273-2079(+)
MCGASGSSLTNTSRSGEMPGGSRMCAPRSPKRRTSSRWQSSHSVSADDGVGSDEEPGPPPPPPPGDPAAPAAGAASDTPCLSCRRALLPLPPAPVAAPLPPMRAAVTAAAAASAASPPCATYSASSSATSSLVISSTWRSECGRRLALVWLAWAGSQVRFGSLGKVQVFGKRVGLVLILVVPAHFPCAFSLRVLFCTFSLCVFPFTFACAVCFVYVLLRIFLRVSSFAFPAYFPCAFPLCSLPCTVCSAPRVPAPECFATLILWCTQT